MLKYLNRFFNLPLFPLSLWWLFHAHHFHNYGCFLIEAWTLEQPVDLSSYIWSSNNDPRVCASIRVAMQLFHLWPCSARTSSTGTVVNGITSLKGGQDSHCQRLGQLLKHNCWTLSSLPKGRGFKSRQELGFFSLYLLIKMSLSRTPT